MATRAGGSATLTHTATGGGYGEAGFTGGGGTDNNQLVVTITDPDVVGLTITSLAGREVREGGSISYSVKLATEPEGTVAIQVSSVQLGVAASTQLTFNAGNWNQAQAVTISVPEGTYSSNSKQRDGQLQR